MPYRALLYTLTTLALAFLSIGMWVRAAAPMLAEVNASTQASTVPAASHPAVFFPTTASALADKPDRQFKGILRATLMLSFVAVGILLAIGFFATVREWMRFRLSDSKKAKRTRYVDAWKLAGERLDAPPGNAAGPEPDARPGGE